MTSPVSRPAGPSSPAGRTCAFCAGPMDGKRRDAIYCSRNCRAAGPRRAQREAVAWARPRCMICGKELKYRSEWQGKGNTLSQTTCSRKCAVTKYNWFGRMPPTGAVRERQLRRWREASARRRAKLRAAA